MYVQWHRSARRHASKADKAQESDLVTTDLESTSLTQHTLNRYASAGGDSASLYGYIRQSNGVNLCDPSCLPRVIRPHDARDLIDEANSLSNLDEEDGVLVHIDFSELLRVKYILLSTPSNGQERPKTCKVWVNRPNGIDLSQTEDVEPDQEFELLEGERGAVPYATRLSRFSNVSSLTLHLVMPNFFYSFKIGTY